MSTKTIRVIVAGANGKMGKEAVLALQADKRFTVVGLLSRSETSSLSDAEISDNPRELIRATSPDVWLDLTDATSVVSHVSIALEHGIRPVVGATGYSSDDLNEWTYVCKQNGLGCIVAPNFSMGALLMMRFAKEAARFYESIEIIEMHHDGKKDAPSGTAKRTAQTIADAGNVGSKRIYHSGQAVPAAADASRGELWEGIPVHSIRLPGLVAHQEVLFGGQGELLTIRHDSMSRQSFMPGVLHSCEKVMTLNTLVYGLEHLLF